MFDSNGQRLEYVMQIIFILSQRANNTSLLQDYLALTAKEIMNLKKKRKAIMREYVTKVKNPLLGYEGLWGIDALKSLGGRFRPDQEWRSYSYYRELFFKDLKYKKKLKNLSSKISSLTERYAVILDRIKSVA